VHVARNSSEVISGITNKVNGVVFGVLLPLLTLVSSTVLLVAIMLALLAIDPMVASVAVVGFGASYALITWMSRRRLHRNSQRIAHEQTQVVKALQEGLGGIRDVLLDGTQPVYCDIYRQADHPLRLAQGNPSAATVSGPGSEASPTCRKASTWPIRYRESGGETGGKEGVKVSNVRPDLEIFLEKVD
jgi:ABC-type transport system involved in cytochrome bd biosynthesis fused ATPase/permease subunit